MAYELTLVYPLGTDNKAHVVAKIDEAGTPRIDLCNQDLSPYRNYNFANLAEFIRVHKAMGMILEDIEKSGKFALPSDQTLWWSVLAR